ncbi:hypothetical protein [Paracoccus sp. IB05]|uniref:hypothetical protein n=1 Tax=Paracoccus sp. IB05 TaxID=2779367 RepID=UPI0018E8B93E|nr:hypothetical protein [Paracoccus sp. IB05]MBJ2150631.1 hypothetical protein [Paracoccus sp. IB05]
MRSIAELGDEAKRSGMSLKGFQEWKYVAEQNRIGIDAVVDGFKELNLRADEFITTGGGSAADAFQRIGFTAADLKAKLKDPSALMLEIIGRLEGMNKAAQIRILDELLGGAGGEQFLQLLDQGEGGMRRLIGRAHEVGAVMSQEMVDKASELDARWNDLAKSVDNTIKAGLLGIVDLVAAGIDAIAILRSAAALPSLNDAAKDLTGIEGVTIASEAAARSLDDLSRAHEMLRQEGPAVSTALYEIVDALDAVGETDAAEEVQAVADRVELLIDQQRTGKISAEQFRDGMGEALSEANELFKGAAAVDGVSLDAVTAQVGGLLRILGLAAAAAASLARNLPGPSFERNGRGGNPGTVLSEFAPTDGRGAKAPERPGVDSYGDWLDAQKPSGGGGGGGRSQDDYAKAIASIKEETAALEAESVAFAYVAASGVRYADAVEYARKRAELLAAAQKQGKEVTPALMAEIDALALAYVNAGDAAEKASKQLQKVEENAETGANAIGNIFGAVMEGSGAAKRAVAQLLLEIAKAQMMSAAMGIFGGTGFARFIGGLMNVGANASGTNNWRGGLTRVNELGGEIMNLPKGTQIIPADVSKRIADRAGQSGGGGHLSIGFDRSTGDLTATMRDVAGQVVQQQRASIVGQSVAATVRTSRQSKSVLGQR